MKPITFIGCMPRSGSSLLRMMLNAHPQILAGRETKWIYKKEHPEFLKNQFKLAELKNQHLVIKSPKNISKVGIQRIKSEYPNHNLVAITRNPKDVYCSYLKSVSEHQAIHEFSKDVNIFAEGVEYLKDIDFHLVKYEDLVSNPKKHLKNLCKFIKMKFNKTMLEHEKHQHNIGQCIFGSAYSDMKALNPVFTDSVNQWKKYKKELKKVSKWMKTLEDATNKLHQYSE